MLCFINPSLPGPLKYYKSPGEANDPFDEVVVLENKRAQLDGYWL